MQIWLASVFLTPATAKSINLYMYYQIILGDRETAGSSTDSSTEHYILLYLVIWCPLRISITLEMALQ